jgi:hypothetical protein
VRAKVGAAAAMAAEVTRNRRRSIVFGMMGVVIVAGYAAR